MQVINATNATNITRSLNLIYNILTTKKTRLEHHTILEYKTIIQSELPTFNFNMNDFNYFYSTIILKSYILKQLDVVISKENNGNMQFYNSLKNDFNEILIQIELINNSKKLMNRINTIRTDIIDIHNLFYENKLSFEQPNPDFDKYQQSTELTLNNISNDTDIQYNRFELREDMEYDTENNTLHNDSQQLDDIKQHLLVLNKIKSRQRVILRSDIIFWLINTAKYPLEKPLPQQIELFNWNIYSEFDKIKMINKICKIKDNSVNNVNTI